MDNESFNLPYETPAIELIAVESEGVIAASADDMDSGGDLYG